MIKHNSWLTNKTIKKIEKDYKSKYVCDTCLTGLYGYIENPVAIFYTTKIHQNGSNYFAMYKNLSDLKVYITNGIEAIEQDFQGAVADNGDIIYSRYRHDYVTSEDGSVSIDGGRDYTKTNTENIVNMKVIGSELVVI